jgi:hypothetical protein
VIDLATSQRIRPIDVLFLQTQYAGVGSEADSEHASIRMSGNSRIDDNCRLFPPALPSWQFGFTIDRHGREARTAVLAIPSGDGNVMMIGSATFGAHLATL